MKASHKNLNNLKPGEACTVLYLENIGYMRRRLTDLGFTKGSKVYCLGTSPFGDPMAFGVKGTIIALRSDDSKKIIVKLSE